MFYLIVFRARSETMKFYSILSSYGVISEIVNTPRQLSVACGISLKLVAKDLVIAKEILNRRLFSTFAGIFVNPTSF